MVETIRLAPQGAGCAEPAGHRTKELALPGAGGLPCLVATSRGRNLKDFGGYNLIGFASEGPPTIIHSSLFPKPARNSLHTTLHRIAFSPPEKDVLISSPGMDEIQNPIRHEEPVKGGSEAYRLGISMQRFRGWVDSVKWFADNSPPPLENWPFPFMSFDNPTNPSSKDRYIDRVAYSVRRLARSRAADPLLVFEMHRLCEDVTKRSNALKLEFKRLNHGGIAKLDRSIRSFYAQLNTVGDELFVGQGKPLRDWYHLGTVLGKVLYLYVLDSNRDTIPHVMTEFFVLGRRLLPENALEEVIRLYDPNARHIGVTSKEEPAGKLITAILKLDKWINRYLANPVSAKPFCVFDDKDKTFTYFGTNISFDDLPAGGLALVRVLVQYPSKPLTAEQIVASTELCVKAPQVPQYLSRFRAALQKLIGERQDHPIEYMPDSKEAMSFFIVADRKERNRDASNETYYKLALPPDRVKYIARK